MHTNNIQGSSNENEESSESKHILQKVRGEHRGYIFGYGCRVDELGSGNLFAHSTLFMLVFYVCQYKMACCQIIFLETGWHGI